MEMLRESLETSSVILWRPYTGLPKGALLLFLEQLMGNTSVIIQRSGAELYVRGSVCDHAHKTCSESYWIITHRGLIYSFAQPKHKHGAMVSFDPEVGTEISSNSLQVCHSAHLLLKLMFWNGMAWLQGCSMVFFISKVCLSTHSAAEHLPHNKLL